MNITSTTLKRLSSVSQRRVTRRKVTLVLESWLGIRRILCGTRRIPRFQLRRGFGEFLRNFAQKLRRAPLGFRRNLFFHKTPDARELFIEAAAELFEFVHFPPRRPLALRVEKRMGAIPVL
jgi:hypothetical protein